MKITLDLPDDAGFAILSVIHGNNKVTTLHLDGTQIKHSNVYAFAGGCPIWCNFILSVIETVDNASEKEYATTNPRLQKYMGKYQKYNR